jgi:hypothetical protein
MAERGTRGSSAAKKTAAGKPDLPEHRTQVQTIPNGLPGEQGGSVFVSCTCGWVRSDGYTRDRLAEDLRATARTWGEQHEEDPDAAPPPEGAG